MRFSGQTALVTGGTSGIGWGVVEALAAEGAQVLTTGLTHEEADTANAKVEGRAIRATQLDVIDSSAVESYVRGIPSLNVLVNCAGTIRRREEYDLAVFEYVIGVNLTGTMRTCQAARALLAKSAGAIVNIGSMYSFFGAAHAPAYAASKGAVVQLTKSLAREYALQGIRVNAVTPGWIKTRITEPVYSDPARSAPIVDRTPLGRWGEPRDVAGPVLFLCSPAAAFVTGVALPIDGGYLLTG
jgi:NAD(P)-dependent dehydrogenase (short-subunit alcohol dehydrogenase family)